MGTTAVSRSWTWRGLWLTVVWLPLVAVAVAWAVSYAHSGVAQWSPAPETCYFLSSHRGYFEFARQSITPGVPPGPYRSDLTRLGRMSIAGDNGSVMMSYPPHRYSQHSYGIGKSSGLAQFGLGEITPSQYRAVATLYAVPYWMPAAVASIAPIVSVVRRVRARRRAMVGRCSKCGYDLRATPDRCPECGFEPAADRVSHEPAQAEQ